MLDTPQQQVIEARNHDFKYNDQTFIAKYR